MQKDEIERLSSLLDERNIRLMEREVELAERFEEISAQKEELTAAIEELTLVNNQLTEKNRELDQILYRASHDLIGPISSIEGILNIISNENIPANIKVYLTHIAHKNGQLREFMIALSTFARITQNVWSLENINVYQAVQSSIADLSYLPHFSSIDFRFDISPDMEIKIDRLVFVTVLKNLLSNAIVFRSRYNVDGCVSINIFNNKNEIKIEVEDDGEGISPSISAKIYDMFYRGSSNSVGLGMGLYMVKKIVQRMNGDIDWICNNGKTIFKVTLTL